MCRQRRGRDGDKKKEAINRRGIVKFRGCKNKERRVATQGKKVCKKEEREHTTEKR